MTWMGGVKRYWPVLAKRLGLLEQIEHQGRGVALAFGERGLAAHDEAQARHAFQALVRGRRHRIVGYRARVERERAEGAHGVDQQAPAMPGHERRRLGDRVEHARRRLAVDGEDVRDRRVVGQHLVELRKIGRRVFRRLVGDDATAGDIRDVPCAMSVGAIDQHQQLARSRHEAGDHGLDGESARALHRHGDMRALAARQLDELLQHHPVDGDEALVARAPVMDHGLLHRRGGGERPGSEQQRIAGFGRGRPCGGHVQPLMRRPAGSYGALSETAAPRRVPARSTSTRPVESHAASTAPPSPRFM